MVVQRYADVTTPSIETLVVDGLTVRACRPLGATRSPVLFVHGYFADATVFDDWLKLFAARGFPAYAVNLRGRAGSRPGTDLGRTSMRDFADDVSAVARSLGSPSIVGHSLGGLLAQMAAARGDASAAVLICPAPPRGIPLLTKRVILMQVKYLWPILRSRVVDPSLEDLRAIALNRVPVAEQGELLAQFVPDSGRAGRDISVGVPVDSARVLCPVLVIASDDDRFIPRRIVERIAARYRAPIRTLAGHAHMLPREPGWQDAAELVAAWLLERA